MLLVVEYVYVSDYISSGCGSLDIYVPGRLVVGYDPVNGDIWLHDMTLSIDC